MPVIVNEDGEKEYTGCPKCGNKIRWDYDDEYCCECYAKLNEG